MTKTRPSFLLVTLAEMLPHPYFYWLTPICSSVWVSPFCKNFHGSSFSCFKFMLGLCILAKEERMTSLASTFTCTDNCCFHWPLVVLVPNEHWPCRDVKTCSPTTLTMMVRFLQGLPCVFEEG